MSNNTTEQKAVAMNIEILATGHGVVNKNGSVGKDLFFKAAEDNGEYYDFSIKSNNNIQLSKAVSYKVPKLDEKGNIVRDANGKIEYTLDRIPICSANTIRNGLRNVGEEHTIMELMTDGELLRYCTNLSNLACGWLGLNRADCKRKSFVNASDCRLVQLEDYYNDELKDFLGNVEGVSTSSLEVKRRGGLNNTFVHTEKLGDTKWYGCAALSLPELQFIGESTALDHYDVPEHLIPAFNAKMVDLGYVTDTNTAYHMRDSAGTTPIIGIKMTDEATVEMAKIIVRNAFRVDIKRAESSFKTKALRVTITYSDGTDKKIRVDKESDIDQISFSVFDKYIPVDYDEARQVNDRMVNDVIKQKKEAEEKAKLAKEAKKANQEKDKDKDGKTGSKSKKKTA